MNSKMKKCVMALIVVVVLVVFGMYASKNYSAVPAPVAKSVPIKNPTGKLPDPPKETQVGPETFAGLESFSQDYTNYSTVCPDIENTPLRDPENEKALLATNDAFSTSELANIEDINESSSTKLDWEKNFQNDASLNTQYLASLLPKADPSRSSIMTPPNATNKTDIRADEAIHYNPSASCLLHKGLTKFNNKQGLPSNAVSA